MIYYKMDYSKGKIYVIKNNIDNDIYVGSTTYTLTVRFKHHKDSINRVREQERKLINKFKEIGFNNFFIELYEDYPCQNKEELRKREGQVIKEIGTLNCCVAGRSKEEYYQEVDKGRRKLIKTELNEKARQYYHDNKEKCQERANIKIVCECGETILKRNKPRHLRRKKHIQAMRIKNGETKEDLIKERRAKDYQRNKDKIRKDQKQYYEKNKDKILKQQTEKVKCDCGITVGRTSLYAHKKSKRHQEYVKNN